MAQTRTRAQDEQETASGHIRSEGAGRWWQEVLVEGQEVWEEWMGQTAENTDRRGKAKVQWRAMEQAAAAVRRGWTKDMERDKVYDRC